jgi:hypothetical protein
MPFDLFAASFYLASRYEEYLETRRDAHGRFEPENSLAYKHGFITEPIINQWSWILAKFIRTKYPQLNFDTITYKHIPTIDIDVAYAYKGRNMIRFLGASFKSLAKLKIADFFERFIVCLGLKKDCSDTYSYIKYWQDFYLCNKPVYFILAGKYSKYDKNLKPSFALMKKLIRQIYGYADLGIHPSYYSQRDKVALKNEIDSLNNITGFPVFRSRSHYLRLFIPDTYIKLQQLGIKEDYTMGYASLLGFRAGICSPYFFYNIESEKKMDIQVFPLTIMDGTPNEYMNLSPDRAVDEIKKIINKVKEVRGTLISLWHNSSLGERENWKGWRTVYEQMMKFGAENG